MVSLANALSNTQKEPLPLTRPCYALTIKSREFWYLSYSGDACGGRLQSPIPHHYINEVKKQQKKKKKKKKKKKTIHKD